MAPHTKEAREQALTRLMHIYGDSIKRMCCIYLRDLSTAEDAAQETFIKAYTHIDPLIDGEIVNERAWLSRIAINTCKDMQRSPWMRFMDRRRAVDELSLPSPSGDDNRLALTDAISKLPSRYKDIVLLHFYQGLSLRACAQILGISAPTASRHLSKALKRLRIDFEGG